MTSSKSNAESVVVDGTDEDDGVRAEQPHAVAVKMAAMLAMRRFVWLGGFK
jgi:hypothetical protein